MDSNKRATKKCPKMIFVHCPKLGARLLESPSYGDDSKKYILEHLTCLCEKIVFKGVLLQKERERETRKTVGNQNLIVICIFSSNFLRIILKAETQFGFIISNTGGVRGKYCISL